MSTTQQHSVLLGVAVYCNADVNYCRRRLCRSHAGRAAGGAQLTGRADVYNPDIESCLLHTDTHTHDLQHVLWCARLLRQLSQLRYVCVVSD